MIFWGEIPPNGNQRKRHVISIKFIRNFSKKSLDLNSVLLEVSITRQGSKKYLLFIKDNCHLVQINPWDPN